MLFDKVCFSSLSRAGYTFYLGLHVHVFVHCSRQSSHTAIVVMCWASIQVSCLSLTDSHSDTSPRPYLEQLCHPSLPTNTHTPRVRLALALSWALKCILIKIWTFKRLGAIVSNDNLFPPPFDFAFVTGVNKRGVGVGVHLFLKNALLGSGLGSGLTLTLKQHLSKKDRPRPRVLLTSLCHFPFICASSGRHFCRVLLLLFSSRKIFLP